jgi:hypothetical protein
MNEKRFCKLVRESVEELELDLRGLRVATSSGSNGYLATPLLAACAGAEVFALAVDSPYATAEALRADTIRIAAALRPAGHIHWVSERSQVPEGIDVFTNLGALRPLDRAVLAKSSKRAAVSYMCEAWEWREGDVDGEYCKQHGIPIAGHNEDFGGDDVFTSTGQLALRMCFEAGLSVRNDAIAVLGSDRFADVLHAALVANGSKAHIVRSASALTEQSVANLDAILVCDYRAHDVVLGGALGPAAKTLAAWNPALTVVQFAGAISADELSGAGLHLHPPEALPPVRMARTLAYVGLRPIVRLMAQGLKVGELLVRQREHGDGQPIPQQYQAFLQPIFFS